MSDLTEAETTILADWESDAFGDTLDGLAVETLHTAVERILTARSADMEARIRAWATEAYTARQWDLATRLRALLDAAPAGGAEDV